MNNNDIKKFITQNIKDFQILNTLNNIEKKHGSGALMGTLTGNPRPITHPNLWDKILENRNDVTWNCGIPHTYSGWYSQIKSQYYDFGYGWKTKLMEDENIIPKLFNPNSKISITLIKLKRIPEICKLGMINLAICENRLFEYENPKIYEARRGKQLKLNGENVNLLALNRIRLNDDTTKWIQYFTTSGPCKGMLENEALEIYLPYKKIYTINEIENMFICLVVQRKQNTGIIKVNILLIKNNPINNKEEVIDITNTYESSNKQWDTNDLTLSIEYINDDDGMEIHIPDNTLIQYDFMQPELEWPKISSLIGPYLECIDIYK